MITITFDKRDFEYDVYELVREFYPDGEIQTRIGEDPGRKEADVTLKILVFYEKKKITVRFLHTAGGGERPIRKNTDGDVQAQAFPAREDMEGSVQADPRADRRGAKDALKNLLYGLLCRETGRTMPWGNLVGIRPTKIAMKLLSGGLSRQEASAQMQQRYSVSAPKADLAAYIADRERRILGSFDYANGYSLYIGIPFCPSICLYCSFSSSPIAQWKNQVDNYLDALCHEMAETRNTFAEKQLQTIYIGGGTPTTLEAAQMDRLLWAVEKNFDLSHLREFTVEAGRPDSITREKLEVMKKHGVSRISINPQTMNQKTLDLIGRHHSVEQIHESFDLARSLGFDNINMDLIVGLPGEGPEEVAYTMQEIIRMAPDDITVHSLALKRASRLTQMKDLYAQISFQNSEQIMESTAKYCRSIGNEPYYLYRQKNMAGNFENTGYAREGKAGLYNILIMEEVQSILALGAGASTKIVYDTGLEPGRPVRIERVENVRDIRSYIDRIDEMISRKKAITWEQHSI